MAETRSFSLSAYDFRTKDRYIPEAYSTGRTLKAKTKPIKSRKWAGGQVFLAAAGAILSAVMLCSSLMAQAKLSEVSNRTVELGRIIEQLQSAQARLEIEHARVFSLEYIEQYALEQLGMQRPAADQIIYIDSSAQGQFPEE